MIFTDSLLNLKGKTIAIDIDGTICEELRTFERPLAKPLKGAAEAVSHLKNNQNTIIFWTGRGWEQFQITKHWLDNHAFVYDQLLMGKPIVNYFIDDRARQFISWDKISF